MSLITKVGILAAAAAVALVGFVALEPAEAGGFNESVSGNFIDTSIDTNNDGTAANYFSGVAKGSGGPSYEGLVEIVFDEVPEGICADGEVEGSLVNYSIVRRYSNGDLLFSRSADGDLCFNLGTGLASLTINAEITGGTGRHAGATGTYSADFTVKLLVPDPMGGIGHGAFYGSVSG